MSSYRVIEHTVPCQHFREYPNAIADEEEVVLHLAVKQYVPLGNLDPQAGDVTIVAAHANGFPKELYEPFWDELIRRTRKHGFRIRSIWMADVANQGQSYILNEDKLGNDPSWFDHSRDLLHLINLKRDQMPRPIVGIGHSMGGAQIVNLAYFHPTLFTTLILLDPVIQIKAAEIRGDGGPPSVAMLSTYRRDVWPSRSFAADSFEKSAFYKTWDPRCLEKWVEYGLRDLPTQNHPNETQEPNRAPKVTLTTPISQEVHTFLRPNYEGYGQNGKPINRKTHADISLAQEIVAPFYRAEAPTVFRRLHELRPSTLYINGAISTTSTPAFNAAKQNTTGIGFSGSGGATEGRVKTIELEGIGHLVPMEVPGLTADHTSEWIGSEMKAWRANRDQRQKEWVSKSLREKQDLDEQWKRNIGGPPNSRGRPKVKDSKI